MWTEARLNEKQHVMSMFERLVLLYIRCDPNGEGLCCVLSVFTGNAPYRSLRRSTRRTSLDIKYLDDLYRERFVSVATQILRELQKAAFWSPQAATHNMNLS